MMVYGNSEGNNIECSIAKIFINNSETSMLCIVNLLYSSTALSFIIIYNLNSKPVGITVLPLQVNLQKYIHLQPWQYIL